MSPGSRCSTTDAGNRQTVSFDFTPDASMAGENIGIAIYLRPQTAVDNVVIEHFAAIPEPGTAATLTGSLALLLARRRRK